jgi:polar amino acid transport system substrate-binding protein
MNLRRSVLLAAAFVLLTVGSLSVARAQEVLRVVTDPTFPPMEFVKDALVSKRADLAMSAIYITDERKKVVDFSDPYFAGGLVVLTTRSGPIKSLKDLDGRRVSVQVGTKSVGFLKDNYPKIERVEVEKNQEMFNLVEIGRADAAVTGKPAAKIFAQAKPSLHVLAEQLTTEDYGIAVRKDAPELRAALNAALKKIKADGTYDKLLNRWFESSK